MNIIVIGPKNKSDIIQGPVINTTSGSKTWSKALSPFFLGPVKLYGNYMSKNMENAWQFSKVYQIFVDKDTGNPSHLYFRWATTGWNDTYAHRYPLGKSMRPEYAWWDGKKLDYIEARKKIYVPLYAEAVKGTEAFKKLQEEAEKNETIYLWDFDGYNHKAMGMTYEDVVDEPSMKMGHAFVLAMLLEGYLQ